VTFAHARHWLGGWRAADGAASRVELVRRYLRAYGPATRADFERWAGMLPPLSRPAWTACLPETVEVEGRKVWAMAGDLAALREAEPADKVRLVPNFDSYLLGHRDRTAVVPRAHAARIYRSAGWVWATVLKQGTLLQHDRLAQVDAEVLEGHRGEVVELQVAQGRRVRPGRPAGSDPRQVAVHGGPVHRPIMARPLRERPPGTGTVELVIGTPHRAAAAPLPYDLLRGWYGPVAREAGRVRRAAGAIPPTGLVFASILSLQVGSAIAKSLFPALGPGGTVVLRIGFAALLLLAVERPRLRGYTRGDYVAVALFGLVVAAMNTSFYNAIARIPLGIAVTVEFVGPLAVAVFGSRRPLDLAWAALAAAGILLLAPTPGTSIDPLGLAFALLGGACWAGYILLNVRVGRAFSGGSGLALAMAVAAVAIVPVGVGARQALAANPGLLAGGLGVALLSTTIPYSLEHAALKRLSARAFGVLVSVEPAVAALVGAVLLGEALGLRGLLALASVSVATAGSALTPRRG
jgi:inner membrane transporter RhtA